MLRCGSVFTRLLLSSQLYKIITVVSLSRRYAKAPAELGSLAVGTNGKCLPAWLMRHVLQDKMIAKVGGNARLAAYSTVCADKKASLFEITCSPRKAERAAGRQSRAVRERRLGPCALFIPAPHARLATQPQARPRREVRRACVRMRRWAGGRRRSFAVAFLVIKKCFIFYFFITTIITNKEINHHGAKTRSRVYNTKQNKGSFPKKK